MLKSSQKSSVPFLFECETQEMLGVMFCSFTSSSPLKLSVE